MAYTVSIHTERYSYNTFEITHVLIGLKTCLTFRSQVPCVDRFIKDI